MLIGSLLVLSGLLTLPLPIPLGLLMLGGGAVLLAHDSRRIRAWLRRKRDRYPALSERLRWLEGRVPRRASRVLQRTDPSRGKQQPVSEQE